LTFGDQFIACSALNWMGLIGWFGRVASFLRVGLLEMGDLSTSEGLTLWLSDPNHNPHAALSSSSTDPLVAAMSLERRRRQAGLSDEQIQMEASLSLSSAGLTRVDEDIGELFAALPLIAPRHYRPLRQRISFIMKQWTKDILQQFHTNRTSFLTKEADKSTKQSTELDTTTDIGTNTPTDASPTTSDKEVDVNEQWYKVTLDDDMIDGVMVAPDTIIKPRGRPSIAVIAQELVPGLYLIVLILLMVLTFLSSLPIDDLMFRRYSLFIESLAQVNSLSHSV
jgi:hypothetical protein